MKNKSIDKMLAKYKLEPDRVKVMLMSINSYIGTILENEKEYADGTFKFPINKSGNPYLDTVIAGIKDLTIAGKGNSDELKEIAKFVATKLDIQKPQFDMKNNPAKKDAEKEPKPTKPVKKGELLSLALLDGAISNINRCQSVLNKRPFNPVDLPSARTHIDASVEKLKAFNQALMESGLFTK